MSGESIQLKMISHQSVESVETEPHVTRAQTQIHPHTGWQVNHPRTISNTIRNVFASASLPIRNRSPLVSTSSNAEVALPISVGLVSSSANCTESRFCSRFRQ
jgi:hypothetical protein